MIVGFSQTAAGPVHATLWRWADGAVEDLGTLPGFDASRALRVNDAGQVVRWSETAGGVTTGPEMAWLWHEGALVALGTLGGTKGPGLRG